MKAGQGTINARPGIAGARVRRAHARRLMQLPLEQRFWTLFPKSQARRSAVSLAVTNLPSASATSTSMKQSAASRVVGSDSHAAGERQCCDPRGRDDAGRRCLSEGVRCVVDVAQRQPPPTRNCRRRRIDPHPLHHGEVDHQAVVHAGEPGPLCPPPRLAIGGLLSRPISTPRKRWLAKGFAYRFAAVAKMAESTYVSPPRPPAGEPKLSAIRTR
jgi:hypothetical protein